MFTRYDWNISKQIHMYSRVSFFLFLSSELTITMERTMGAGKSPTCYDVVVGEEELTDEEN